MGFGRLLVVHFYNRNTYGGWKCCLVEWVLFDTHTESVYEAAEKSYMEDESDDFDF